MKNKKQYPFLALVSYAFLLVFYQSPAQSGPVPEQYIINGTVEDSYGPLPGVHVLIKDTNSGTFTDKNGEFSLTVTATNTLVFSYLGYHTLEVSILGQTTLEVELLPEATQLQEVEVNAGYYTVKERERTGSISRVTAEEIGMQPVSNPLAALQGRMTGVDIVPTTGIAGGGYRVQIRGINSIAAGNKPLYVVDGIPYGSGSLGGSSLATSLTPLGEFSPLSAIDPSQIESIEVLKDADATAIYGSRGANGVVLITTKKGAPGKTEVKVSLTNGLGRVAKFMDLMDTSSYLEMRREAFANDGITDYPVNAYDVNGTWDQNRSTDWQKELIGGTSYQQRSLISFSGSDARTHFLLSGGHHYETTVFPGEYRYIKTMAHAVAGHKSMDGRIHFDFSADYTAEDNKLPTSDFTFQARTLAPNAPELYDGDDNLNWANNTWTNPLARLVEDYRIKRNILIAQGNFRYEPVPDIEFKVHLGYNHMVLTEYRTSPHTVYNPVYNVDSRYSSIYSRDGSMGSWIIEPQVQWESNKGKFSWSILAGTSFQRERTSEISQFGRGFASDALMFDLSAADIHTINKDTETKYSYQALYGRLNFNWNKRYILNITGRRDGSSRFGPEKRFGNFGAIGAAWIFSDIRFLKERLDALDFGKIRGSYGITGNDQIGDYRYMDTYSNSGIHYDGITGLRPTQLFNPLFGWEENRKLELGMEIGFWKGRLFLSASWYQNRSSNQLVGIPLPTTTGFRSLYANLDAKVQNSGVEILLRVRPVDLPKFDWDATLTLTAPQNKLLAFPGLEASPYANTYVVGKPLTIRKLYNYKGLDTETGVYRFEDYDGDNAISTPNDRQWIVDTSPQYYGGIDNILNWGRVQFDFFLQFKKQLGSNPLLTNTLPGSQTNQPIVLLDRWQRPGDVGLSQRYTTGVNSEASLAFSRQVTGSGSITDMSFIRLRSVSLSFDFSKELIPGIGCRIRVHGQNLWAWSPFKYGDPEQITQFLPQLKQYTLGVELRF